jgi:2-polyprenyl-6-methoxyphenol hydroxylase-like FAD-dependent oxidoreductase
MLAISRRLANLPQWMPSSVTLLGDAIHTMTLASAIGSNTAPRDVVILRHGWANASAGKHSSVQVIIHKQCECATSLLITRVAGES